MPLPHSLGRSLARFLSQPRPQHRRLPYFAPAHLAETLRPGDVLLVEGTSRFATAIQYLTQSTWTHAALYVGQHLGPQPSLVEADVVEGVRLRPLSASAGEHTRICRPVGLGEDDVAALLAFVQHRLGDAYDLRNVLDLARYLLPLPLPGPWRRRMIAVGSGTPTRAICSTLLAEAFESIRYPILPEVEHVDAMRTGSAQARGELLHIRQSRLFVPRDFDVSPYFSIVKPRLNDAFDFHRLQWAPPDEPS